MRIRRLGTIVFAAALALFVMQCGAFAQQGVKLEFKANKGDMFKYVLNVGGTLNMNLNELPVPRSKMKIDNMKAAVSADVYFDTLDATGTVYTFDVKAVLDKLTLGGLLKLDGLGFKSTALSPKITMTVDSTGKIQSLDMGDLEMPGGAAGMGKKIPGMDMLGMGQLKDMLPMIIGIAPSILPKKEIPVGGTWKSEINFDSMGMGSIFPRIPFNFKLVSMKDGVANIEFTSKGKFNGDFLNGFLALIPEIPMGDDIFKIGKINLVVDWEGAGTIKFAVDKGRVDDANMSTSYHITLGADTTFKHADEKTDTWNSDGTVDMIIDMDLKYDGAPKREDVQQIFETPASEGADETAPVEDAPPADDSGKTL